MIVSLSGIGDQTGKTQQVEKIIFAEFEHLYQSQGKQVDVSDCKED